ncbi:uncharacterized protein LOC132554658 [Ylistrum balloti]|uniref:uncharacterized protein LOC132554658 n=1 Tax=Ylistrum balloti TaxID=509963 RepID=UPI002905902F|nr:uncharacterized protein LOC132554658 [Ylistrum balloti]
MDRRSDLEATSRSISQRLDALIGTEEEVSIRRQMILFTDYLLSGDSDYSHTISTGSFADGFSIPGSDTDMMCVVRNVKVICPRTYTASPPGRNETNSILVMRNVDGRPGYVTLELAHREHPTEALKSAMVLKEGVIMISSDMYRQYLVDFSSKQEGLSLISNGPCQSFQNDSVHINFDIAESFACHVWPEVAEEWKQRPKTHGWPDSIITDKIIQGGCHILPVGDKTSPDTFLQWRISFVTAERLLVHSFRHLQFKVYGLLKYFLKDVRKHLCSVGVNDDIVTSYFMKTLIFHVLETTPKTLWQDKNTLVCFLVCLRVLIDWLRSGYCPHYFIPTNNLFKRHIHGDNRRKLLDIVVDFHDRQYLSFLHKICPGIQDSVASDYLRLECNRDQTLFRECSHCIDFIGGDPKRINKSNKILMAAQSEASVFGAFYATTYMLSSTARRTFPMHANLPNNKTKYAVLRMCKTFLLYYDLICSAPLQLATLFFLLGNFRKSLSLCEDTISSHKDTICMSSEKDLAKYKQLYCGKSYSLLQKFKVKRSVAIFRRGMLEFSLPHIRPEIKQNPFGILIPQLPYAVFLGFLCYHELGMISKRDDALHKLIVIKYDDEQGGDLHWIVYTLLGICYQILSDNRRAVRCFLDSYRVQKEFNPALERVKLLRNSF